MKEEDEFLTVSYRINCLLNSAMADKQPRDPPPNPVDEHKDEEPIKQKDPKDPMGPGTSMGTLVAEITQQVLAALQKKQSSSTGEPIPPTTFHPARV